MEIIAKSENLTDRELFKMVNGDGLGRIKDNAGRVIDIVGYVMYTDINQSDGKEHTIVVFKTADGDFIASNSPTVVRSFEAMVKCFEFPLEGVEIVSGKSKAGREFYNLALV